MIRVLIFSAVFLCVHDVLAQRVGFKNYRYNPWTGRTSSVEEFDEDVRNMNPKQLQRYLKELRKVRKAFNDMRRESEILERELGFGLGGFPSLMDNSENVIRHALNSVTDQLQKRIGHHIDPKLIEDQFDEKVKSADRPTLQRNLDRLQQTKREIAGARQHAQALKNDLGFDFDQIALDRAESAVNHGMDVINHRIQRMDHPNATHTQLGNANVTKTMNKVDNAVQRADRQQLDKFDNEFKKMKEYMDNVKTQLDNFHRDIGFEFDGVFEPFTMAESILNHGLNAISRQLQGAQQSQQQQTGGASPQASYNQQNQTVASQQAAYNQQNSSTSPQQPHQQTQTSQ